MELLIIRHGIAESTGPDGSDASRRLTDEGIEKTKLAARGLARIIDPPQALLTSPKTRAIQTADIFAAQFGIHTQVTRSLGEGSTTRILGELRKRREASVCIIGHEPTFSTLIERLCDPDTSGGFISMKKAGCVCIEVDLDDTGLRGRGHLVFLTPPRILRALGGE